MKKVIIVCIFLTAVVLNSTAQMTVSKTGFSLPANTDPLIFKTNNAERMRILSNGNVGIGTPNPIYKLDVTGDARISNNLYVGGGIVITNKVNASSDITTIKLLTDSILVDSTKGFYGTTRFNGIVNMQNKLNVFGNATINGTLTALSFNVTNGISAKELKTNRIRATHPDSAIYLGDSTIKFDPNTSRMYSDEGATFKGISIGRGFSGNAPLYSATGNRAIGIASTIIGYNLQTNGSAIRAIVIGSGTSTDAQKLVNTIDNTLMIGFNSTIPTLFVSKSNGAGTTGNVSIGGNTIPLQKLDINGKLNITEGVIQKGGAAITGTADLGLYSLDPNTWMRFVTNNQPFKFYANGGTSPFYGTGLPLMVIEPNGNVGIGTDLYSNSYNNTPGYFKLSVNGPLRAKEVMIETGWADFVFCENYKLRTITEVDQYIKQNGRLPEIPTALEIEKNGGSVGELLKLQMQKIEELTLYIIEQEKRIKLLEQK